jgi:hypothetical protein
MNTKLHIDLLSIGAFVVSAIAVVFMVVLLWPR